jgi:Flp pilus assembly protein TadD
MNKAFMEHRKMKQQSLTIASFENEVTQTSDSALTMLTTMVPAETRTHLVRMFRDPYVLEQDERAELVLQLREAVSLEPHVPELRVLLGMALCVNLDAQTALDELREAVKMAPENFIARLKFGELLMRLRICSQAAEETQIAAKLASTPIQSELARRQATTIRTMQREGIERGGYGKLLSAFDRVGRLFTRAEQGKSTIALNSR